MDITKQKNIFLKKFKGKATTLSNLIDIEDPKANTKFFNFSILNTPNIIESSVNTTDITEFTDFTDAKLDKMNATNITEFFLNTKENFSSTELKKSTVPNCTIVSTTNDEDRSYSPTYVKWINLNEYNFSISTPTDTGINYYTNSVDSASTTVSYNEDSNKHYTVPNITLPTKWNEKNHTKKLKLKVTFVSTIELIIDNFFNKNLNREDKKISVGDKSVIDLTKNRCEKKVKLNNGIILAQDCEGDSKHSVYSGRKFSNRCT